MKNPVLSIVFFISTISYAQEIPGKIIRPVDLKRSQESAVQVPAVPLKVNLFVRKTPSREPRWFISIKDALDDAVENNYPMIRITVYPGTYAEPLRITRPTTIQGYTKGAIIQGSISNSGGHDLALIRITMRNCRPYGLIQRGGTLNLTDVEIYRTRSTEADSHSGIAVEIADGVVGRFTNVTLNDNQGLALLMSGSGTKVLAQSLRVRNNRINRCIIESGSAGSWTQRIAAVEVADGALLLANNPVIEGNEFTGVLARNGGQVHLRGGRVTNTKNIDYESRRWGGINVASRSRARIELQNMQVSGAQLAGIQNSTAWFKILDTHVIDNVIGVHVKGNVSPDYDPVACLSVSGNIYDDNDRNFDSDYLPVPDTGLCEDSPPNCPGVAWVF